MKKSGLRSTIQTRLTLFFIVVVMLPVTLITVYTFQRTQYAMHVKVSESATELMNMLGDNIDREIKTVENIMIDVSYSDSVQRLIFDSSDLTLAEQNSIRSDIRMDIALKASHYREITDMFATVSEDASLVLYGDKNFKFRLRDDVLDSFIERAHIEDPRKVMAPFSGDQQIKNMRYRQDAAMGIESGFLMGRTVHELNGDGVECIVFRISGQLIKNSISSVKAGDGSIIVIADDAGNIISSTRSDIFKTAGSIGGLLALEKKISDVNGDETRLGDENYVVVQSPVPDTDWHAICLLPYSYIDSETYQLKRNMFAALAVLFAVMLLGVMLLYRSVSKPLYEIVKAMNSVENGNLDIEVRNDNSDEIGQVARSFNRMLARIRVLLENVRQKEKQKRKAELSALQAQINPHFISNTLNTVRLLAHNQKAENIENLLVAFIDLLHVSMDTTNDIITVDEEIRQLKSYVEIMRYRDYSEFRVEYDIQAGCGDCLIPKLILQPIVENSLIHGVLSKKNDGQIRVSVSVNEGRLLASITDNGDGIPEDQLATVLTKKQNDTRSRFSGIGLSNVNERIKILYGEEYGVFLESIYQMYTTVDVVLPVIKDGTK